MTADVMPIFDHEGLLIGSIGPFATSVEAAKIAGGAVEFSRRFGVEGWVRKYKNCAWLKATDCEMCNGPAYCPKYRGCQPTELLFFDDP